jgi:hypothetical protein
VQYRVTYQPAAERPAETIEVDRHSLQAGGTSLVFRAVERVAFQEREIVVRRSTPARCWPSTPAGRPRLPAGRTVTARSGQAAG